MGSLGAAIARTEISPANKQVLQREEEPKSEIISMRRSLTNPNLVVTVSNVAGKLKEDYKVEACTPSW